MTNILLSFIIILLLALRAGADSESGSGVGGGVEWGQWNPDLTQNFISWEFFIHYDTVSYPKYSYPLLFILYITSAISFFCLLT